MALDQIFLTGDLYLRCGQVSACGCDLGDQAVTLGFSRGHGGSRADIAFRQIGRAGRHKAGFFELRVQ